jgi:hypothetical protein
MIPFVLPDIIDFVPLLRISTENTFQQISRFFGDKPRDLKVTLQNFLIQVCCVGIFERKISTDQGEHDDTTGPYISIQSLIPKTSNHLRGSIARTATCCLESLTLLVSVGKSEIYNLDVLVLI